MSDAKESLLILARSFAAVAKTADHAYQACQAKNPLEVAQDIVALRVSAQALVEHALPLIMGMLTDAERDNVAATAGLAVLIKDTVLGAPEEPTPPTGDQN